MRNNKYEYSCRVCGKKEKTFLPNKVTCSKQCMNKFYGRIGNIKGISSSSVGSISEMMICAEMLTRGYSVFRTVSNSSFCDVIAVKGIDIKFIEVRTGYKSLISEKITFPKKIHDKIAVPTHYGIYLQASDEIIIEKITNDDVKKYGTKN